MVHLIGRPVKRVRGGDASEPSKHLAPEPLTPHREPSPLGISEAETLPTELLADYPVLLSQVVDRVPLLAVEPASNCQDDEL